MGFSRWFGRELFVATVVLAGMSRGSPVRAAEQNACGCYRTDVGACLCDRKARCGCPGDCEPQGCEEERNKAFQREVQAETRRAEEAARKLGTPDDGRDSNDGEAAARAASKPPPPPAPAPVHRSHRKLTDAQAKQLVKFLDLYLEEHPDASATTASELREKLTRTR
jgi:hypothetical protein